MAALPYMQLYVADYLADTPHLTTEEHGAYLLLLFSYWQTGKPLRVDRLASSAKLSNERWTDVQRSLKEFFEEVDGVWIHRRVEKDLEKVAVKAGKNSDAGKASAAARAFAKQQLERIAAESIPTSVITNVERPLNECSTIEDTDKDKEQNKDQKPLSPGKPDDAKTAKVEIPFLKIMERYNTICGATFKRAAEMNEARKKNISKCWNRKVRGVAVFQSGKFWELYFNWCLRNTHWAGEAGKSWRASLEFVTRPDKVDVIIDEMSGEGIFGDE